MTVKKPSSISLSFFSDNRATGRPTIESPERMNTPTDERRAGRDAGTARTVMAVLGLTLAGLALRLISIDSRGLWLDEAITVVQASKSLIGVVLRQAAGVHPPLYHILIHTWMYVFGRSEVAIRSFSVIVGVAAIPVAYWAASRIYRRRTGLIAAGLVALSPLQIWYSQEARMYEMLFLTGLLSTAFLALAVRENRARLWIGYLVSTLAGLFTHYFFVFLVFGQAGYYLLGELVPKVREQTGESLASRVRHPLRLFREVPTLAPWFACSMVMALLLMMWMSNSVLLPGKQTALVKSAQGSGLGYGQEAASVALRFNDMVAVIVQMFGGFHTLKATDILIAMWPLSIYLTLLLLHLMKPATRNTTLLLGAASGLIVLMALGQWQGQILTVRYFMAVAAPAFLLVARLLDRMERPLGLLVMSGLTVVALVAWFDQSYNPKNTMRYDNREALGTIADEAREGDLVLYVPFYLDPLTNYYLPPDIQREGFPQYGANSRERDKPLQIEQDMDRLVPGTRRVWLYLSFQNIATVRADSYVMIYWLKHHDYKVRLKRRMNQVDLYLWENPRPGRFFQGPDSASLDSPTEATITPSAEGVAP